MSKYFQLFIPFFIYSFAGVASKMAALSGISVRFFVLVGFQIFLLGIYALVWQQVIKKHTLVMAMACRGVVVILSLLWAIIFFEESISLFNILGSIVIGIGIYVVSTGEVSREERSEA